MATPTYRAMMRASEAWRTAVRDHGTDSIQAYRAKVRADGIRSALKAAEGSK